MKMVGRAVGRVQPMAWHRNRPGFDSAASPDGLRMDPFIRVDHFRMSEPIFPPHPHAGFSAISLMFEDSPGSFSNRDSNGESSIIRPGGVQWTTAGRGVVHEEIPLDRGTEGHGLQIFLNLPLKDKTCEPKSHKLSPSEVAEKTVAGGARVRVIAGEVEGTASSLNSKVLPEGVVLMDIHMDQPGASFEIPLPQDFNASIMVIQGSVDFGGKVVTKDQMCDFDPPAGPSSAAVVGKATGTGPAQAVLLAGRPLRDPIVWRGPFCGSSVEQVTQFINAYQTGLMGSLEPTPGAFSGR